MRNPTLVFSIAAICLVAGLQPNDSVAYPGSAAISYGQNPVWAEGGFVNGSITREITTAPAGQTLIVTDVHLTMGSDDTGYDCIAMWSINLETDGSTLGSFAVQQFRDSSGQTAGHPFTNATFSSGLPVASGQTLNLVATLIHSDSCSGGPRIHYTISGYVAQS